MLRWMTTGRRSLHAQGELYFKVAGICLQNPSCRVLQTWGFTDKYSWIPSHSKGRQGWALPFDAVYQKKPAYDSMLRALYRSPLVGVGEAPLVRRLHP
jgi:endo-1,4-beta-xylanase